MQRETQRIITIDAKSLFKYFPKTNKTLEQPFLFDTRKRSLYTLVAKENELEECPILDQFIEILKEDFGNKIERADNNLLYNQFLIMDFDNIFMPIDENASAAARKRREELQRNVKDLMEKGFKIQFDNQVVHMMPFDKSGNMSRNGRISFINKEYVGRLNERLNLGMDFSKIKVILSKYYAYRGLYLSTSQRVDIEGFELTPETVVIIRDTREASGVSYEKDVKVETAEGINEKEGEAAKDWKFLEPIEHEYVYVDKPYDGEGFITPTYSEYINNTLRISGANSFQIRLPFAKGMLHQVNIIDFINEYTAEGLGDEKYLYVDAFGIERDLRKAHILMTESMFKGKEWLETYCDEHKIEDPMRYYCDAIAKYNHGFYVSGTNLPYGHSRYTHLSYQTINTLAFDDEQFERIMEGHAKFIKEPIEFLKNWDELENDEVVKEDNKENYHVPNWKRAVIKNPSFTRDIYISEQLENTQKSLLSKIALGKILVEGQTRYLCRDLSPLLFSLLRTDKDVNRAYLRYLYTRFYLPQGENNKLELGFKDCCAFFRNPHLSRNEQYIIRPFVHPSSEDDYAKDGAKSFEKYTKYVNMYNKYFGHLTGIVMVPRSSTLPLCLGGADFDGDLVSVVSNKDVVDAVIKGVFEEMYSPSLNYYKRKLSAISIPSTKAEPTYVPEYVEYEHIYNTFSNHIGQISNTAIAIGQVEYDRNKENESEFDANAATCAKCTILTGLEIDAAKNGVHPNLDIILKSNINKSSYLHFLRQFRELKAEEHFHIDRIKIRKEILSAAEGGKERIVIGTTSCQTEVKWYPENEENGTYINLLPKYFLEYYNTFKMLKSSKCKINLTMPELGSHELNLIKAFNKTCDEIIRIYLFYKNKFMRRLTWEKNRGYYAVENTELSIMRRYDEACVDARLFETLVSVKDKIVKTLSEEATVKDIRERINSERWLFQPASKREQALEKIIGNGFEIKDLTKEERELLCDFNQQGYKMLWRVMDLIEGPKRPTFDELQEKLQKDRDELQDKDDLKIDEYKRLESLLKEELKRYYEKNAMDIERTLYECCLGALRNVTDNYMEIVVDISELVIDLYNNTSSQVSRAKFFWDVFTWEEIQCIVEDKGGSE